MHPARPLRPDLQEAIRVRSKLRLKYAVDQLFAFIQSTLLMDQPFISCFGQPTLQFDVPQVYLKHFGALAREQKIEQYLLHFQALQAALKEHAYQDEEGQTLSQVKVWHGAWKGWSAGTMLLQSNKGQLQVTSRGRTQSLRLCWFLARACRRSSTGLVLQWQVRKLKLGFSAQTQRDRWLAVFMWAQLKSIWSWLNSALGSQGKG